VKPALSVIFFTVGSGAGLGLMVWLLTAQLTGRTGAASAEFWGGAVLAAVLLTAGLLSSTAHLANPRNAWRSFARFRTSWLSREGVLAVILYPLAALHLLLTWSGAAAAPLTAVALLLLALAVVVSTGMIYACLKTVPRWRTWHTPVRFVLHALASGLLLWLAISDFTVRSGASGWPGAAAGWSAWAAALIFAAVAVELLFVAKFSGSRLATINDALAVPATAPAGRVQGRVRLLDAGHAHGTFLTHEFGFRLARERALALRIAMFVLLAAVPLAVLWIAPGAAWIAAGSFVAGALLERWLFFAQAEHVVRLYHGQQSV
jgi:sulfite dehydrogenase (quinone) subunit SoeC